MLQLCPFQHYAQMKPIMPKEYAAYFTQAYISFFFAQNDVINKLDSRARSRSRDLTLWPQLLWRAECMLEYLLYIYGPGSSASGSRRVL